MNSVEQAGGVTLWRCPSCPLIIVGEDDGRIQEHVKEHYE